MAKSTTTTSSNVVKVGNFEITKGKVNGKAWRDRILEDLGVYGWDAISLYVFSCFLSGTTPCIVGFHGSAKTMGFTRLAKSLGMVSQLWDASKVTEEVLGGMYNIEMLKQGKQEYIKDANSNAVWGKQIGIIDELTRATPANQNQLLELIRNKTFNGVRTELMLTIATANDLSYSNTEPLDQAFAGRIGLVFRVPEIFNMGSEELRQRIISNTEGCDNLMLSFWDKNRKQAEDLIEWDRIKAEVYTYFEEAAQKYSQIEATYRDMFKKYVDVAMQALHKKAGLGLGNKGLPEGSLDGRRGGMILRNIIAGIAVAYTEGDLNTRELQNTVEDIWKHSFTFELTGSKIEQKVLSEAHAIAQAYIEAKNLVTVAIMQEKNPIRQLMLSVVLHDEDPIALFDICEKLFTDAFEDKKGRNKEEQKESQMQAYLLAIVAKNKDRIFDVFKNKQEYAEIMERITDLQSKIIRETADKLDRKLKSFRSTSASGNGKVITDYFDDRFCQMLNMSREEVTKEIKRIAAITDADKKNAEEGKLREKSELWITALQLLNLTLENQTFDLEPKYVQNMFEKSLEYVENTMDVIRADYDQVKRDLLVA